jgi:hypothetical protein
MLCMKRNVEEDGLAHVERPGPACCVHVRETLLQQPQGVCQVSLTGPRMKGVWVLQAAKRMRGSPLDGGGVPTPTASEVVSPQGTIRAQHIAARRPTIPSTWRATFSAGCVFLHMPRQLKLLHAPYTDRDARHMQITDLKQRRYGKLIVGCSEGQAMGGAFGTKSVQQSGRQVNGGMAQRSQMVVPPISDVDVRSMEQGELRGSDDEPLLTSKSLPAS